MVVAVVLKILFQVCSLDFHVMLHGIEQRSRGTKNGKSLKSISFPARSIILLSNLNTGSAETPFKDHGCFSLELGEPKRSLWTRDFQDSALEMFPINCLFTCAYGKWPDKRIQNRP